MLGVEEDGLACDVRAVPALAGGEVGIAEGGALEAGFILRKPAIKIPQSEQRQRVVSAQVVLVGPALHRVLQKLERFARLSVFQERQAQVVGGVEVVGVELKGQLVLLDGFAELREHLEDVTEGDVRPGFGGLKCGAAPGGFIGFVKAIEMAQHIRKAC